MTYCIGWKSPSHAFLLADSAITSPQPLTRQTTSFGEQHTNDHGQSVQERSLKVINYGVAALTYAGDQRLALSIAGSLKLLLDQGGEVLPSFRQALEINNPQPSGRSAALLLAFHDSAGPRLIFCDSGECEEFHEIERIEQIGSIDEEHARLSHDLLNSISSLAYNRNLTLSAVIAFIQSYGIHSYLLERGVGGFFAGIAVGPEGVTWQPDLSYMLYNADHDEAFSRGKSVASVVRQNALSVRTDVADVPPATFTCRLGNETRESATNRAETAYQACLEAARTCQFYAIAMINRRFPRVTIVEMRHELRHRHLVIDPTNLSMDEDVGLYEIRISPHLLEILVGGPPEGADLSMSDPSLHVCPFQPFEGM